MSKYNRESFRQFIIEKAVSHGDFLMASGQRSDLLIDLSRVLRHVDMYHYLEWNISWDEWIGSGAIAGGPLTCSDLVCQYLSQCGFIEEWFGVRKESKGRGFDQDLITGNFDPTKNIVLVDDVMTTGKSALRAAEAIQNAGGKIISAFTIVDRGGMKNVMELLDIPGYAIFTLEDFQ